MELKVKIVDYKELMSHNPTKLRCSGIINSHGQTVDFYEDPLIGEDGSVIGVINEVAFKTGFFDTGDLFEKSDYLPVLISGSSVICEFELYYKEGLKANDLDRIKIDPSYVRKELKKTEINIFLVLTLLLILLGYGVVAGNLVILATLSLIPLVVIFLTSIRTDKPLSQVISSIYSAWRKGLKHLI